MYDLQQTSSRTATTGEKDKFAKSQSEYFTKSSTYTKKPSPQYTFYTDASSSNNNNNTDDYYFDFEEENDNDTYTWHFKDNTHSNKKQSKKHSSTYSTPNENGNQDRYYKSFFKQFFQENDNNEEKKNSRTDKQNSSKKAKKSKSKPTDSSHGRPKWNNHWAYDEDGNIDEQMNDNIYNESQKTSASYNDPRFGFQFENNDPFEMFEAFAMYKMFKDMTHQMFDDISNEDLLLHLATIISAFNLSGNGGAATASNSRHSHAHAHTHAHANAYPKTHTTQSPKLPKMKNLNKTTTSTSNRTRKENNNEDNWEFEWLGGENGKKTKKSRKFKSPKMPSFMYNENTSDYEYEDYDDGYDDDYNSDINYDSFDDEDESLFNTTKYHKCSYCSKILDNEESLTKHELICKRLSHNFTKTSTASSNPKQRSNHTNDIPSSSSMTKCPICKCKMSSHEYLMHNCLMRDSTSNQPAPPPPPPQHKSEFEDHNSESKFHSSSFAKDTNDNANQAKKSKQNMSRNSASKKTNNNEPTNNDKKPANSKPANFTGLKREKMKSGINIK